MIELRIKARVALNESELPRAAADELCDAFTHDNPQHAKLKRMGFAAAYREPRIIRTWERIDGAAGPVLTFPRGGIGKVRDVLRGVVPWHTDDQRTVGDPALAGSVPQHRVDLYPFQAAMVDAALERENCLLRAPTGSGKTTAAIGIIARLQLPALVVVWNGALLQQWVERLCAELGLRRNEIGVLRGPAKRLMPITVAMQQTLWRLSEEQWHWLDSKVGAVVCDETQRFAASTFTQVIDRFSARYRIGISADETRKDGKEFLIYEQFGDVAAEVLQDDLIEQGFIHDVEVHVVPTDYDDPEYRDACAAEDHVADFNAMLDKMQADEARNAEVMTWALSEAQRGQQVIAFSHRREHCQRLNAIAAAAGVPSGLMLGSKEDEEEFARSVQAIRSGQLHFAAGTYGAIGQGLDLPSVGCGIAATPIANNRQFWGQVRGRMCRKAEGKGRAVLYYMWDRKLFGLTALENLCRWNKKVFVYDGAPTRWADGRQFLKEARNEAKKRSNIRFADFG